MALNRKTLVTITFSSIAIMSAACAPATTDPHNSDDETAIASEDPYLWLEEIEGERALAWVEQENERSLPELTSHPLFDTLHQEATDILTSDSRLPYGQIMGDYIYNHWQDDMHVRGLWRRSPLADYLIGAPNWTTLIDIDQLARDEEENWVFHNSNCLGKRSDRCMIELSRGGQDKAVFREFSLDTVEFVAGGFEVPEARTFVSWVDQDHLLVATDWSDDSLTSSGYSNEVRLWRRGSSLNEATSVKKISNNDTLIGPSLLKSKEGKISLLFRYFSDWNEQEVTLFSADGELTTLPFPRRSDVHGLIGREIIIGLREVWDYSSQSFQIGDIVSYHLDTNTATLVLRPGANQAVNDVTIAGDYLAIEMLEDVNGALWRMKRNGPEWTSQSIGVPDNGVVEIVSAADDGEHLLISYESFTQPNTLYDVGPDNAITRVMATDDLYDASDVEVRQHFATSKDGTRVPYYLIGKKAVLDAGDAPAIEYAYGGFLSAVRPVYYENPSRPQHGALAGKLWISRGGILALANIRGGGEYGPAWHSAALKENRQKAFDDYYAVAEDMIAKGYTNSEKLGALGRSNGGLLLGAALTQRPDLYAAYDIGVPLLDMLRYSQLGAGASWTGEYGDPAIAEERAFLEDYSPYQNLERGQPYPKVLFYTSTQDDRVHPGHARKMAAKMRDYGYDFYYYENTEGGHGGTANQEQLAFRTALEYVYFFTMLFPE
ncbi:prolyl oligopeptidase family serine peptidase [Hyphococcus flavus]|uniref:Prolyl oligopeptidase family serine peptidase n=1 Tax=Hyphococcus flavus TaxID=1866326 RepID=A0AAE9ZHK4_9PROT|nr:prolyl oligopeptidase family serine peptidase [Hyphococcus flavus]WDI32722.1 prolyl oligopeptidase family serine peptidase [Hyphococcus flavus]